MLVIEEVAERLNMLDLSKPTLFCGDFNARVDRAGVEKTHGRKLIKNLMGATFQPRIVPIARWRRASRLKKPYKCTACAGVCITAPWRPVL
jgi:hypothetical protein